MNTRKHFLLASSLLALAAAPSNAATPSPAPANTPRPELRFDFDEQRFNAILAQPAKHRQCFGAVKIDGGSVLNGMANTMDAYEHYLGEPAGSVHTVAVLYHDTAIALAMNDDVWNGLLLPTVKGAPAAIKGEFGTLHPGKGNPYRSQVAGMVKRGSHFFVCHNAIAGFSGIVADAIKRPLETVHAEILAGLLPGALAVPAGVMAVNACQEAKFTYIQSSV